MAEQKLPVPIDRSSRSCYGVLWFATEADAQIWHEHIRARGDRYNGGFYDGLACGRETQQDTRDADGVVVKYAVTTA